MPRKKLKKILEVDSLPNVFCPLGEKGETGLWNYLPNNRDLTLEIGCGRGDYSIQLAQENPNCNFVGLDIKGARLWTASKWAAQLGLKNVAFLRAPAQCLSDYFVAKSVDEIWIPFPDPFPKKRNTKWRVTSPDFLKNYRYVLKAGGMIHLKTDDQEFYDYSCAVLKQEPVKVFRQSADIHSDGIDGPVTEIRTKYEAKHLARGKAIKYVCFGF